MLYNIYIYYIQYYEYIIHKKGIPGSINLVI